jgi:hypothetical protein
MVFNHGSNGKIMTAWALMRLVEARKVEFDAPANRYLKRWQIRSTKFDPNGVTASYSGSTKASPGRLPERRGERREATHPRWASARAGCLQVLSEICIQISDRLRRGGAPNASKRPIVNRLRGLVLTPP